MTHAYALSQIYLEIKQILENYENSLSRTNGPLLQNCDEEQIIINEVKMYIKYAIVIYGSALRLCEMMLAEKNTI